MDSTRLSLSFLLQWWLLLFDNIAILVERVIAAYNHPVLNNCCISYLNIVTYHMSLNDISQHNVLFSTDEYIQCNH